MIRTPHDHEKDMSGCAIAGLMSESGALFSGEQVVRMIANMHERSNGLGGGFAGYGIYPEHPDDYALHVMYESRHAKQETESVLTSRCTIHEDEPIPTRSVAAVRDAPILHRYFVGVRPERFAGNGGRSEDDVIVDTVMGINAKVEGAFVFSSGRNMGVFKGVGYPEDIGAFFRIDEYNGHTWIAHGRFPTNTPGWWGGAHPFALLDLAVVHNGEISSYGTNRRYLANFGYECTLQTDTEVIAYMFDLLVRRQGLSFEAASLALAPPFWSEIARMPTEQQEVARAIRMVYGGALLNGPFSVLVGHSRGMVALNDRTKLRPMVAARRGDVLYTASEEAAIREVCPDPETVWHPEGGVPVIGQLREPAAEPTRREREVHLVGPRAPAVPAGLAAL
jgi:glutamate synthase domain-containing protein 1